MNNKDMPAMPIFGESGYISTDYTGLTKREMFAMAAMQGYISAGGGRMPEPEYIANLSVCAADALLDLLDKEG